jgi:hypothetical protein
VNKKQRSLLVEWSSQHLSCAVCFWPESDHRRRMEVHHLVGGVNRSKCHDPRCYLSLCERCHGVYHSGKIYALTPDLNMGILLTAKRESDPENYDPEWLAAVKNKKHLGWEPEPIPQFFLDERERNLTWSSRSP